MRPIVINIQNLIENISITDLQGSQKIEGIIAETLNKVIQNSFLAVNTENIENSKPNSGSISVKEIFANSQSQFDAQIEEVMTANEGKNITVTKKYIAVCLIS